MECDTEITCVVQYSKIAYKLSVRLSRGRVLGGRVLGGRGLCRVQMG